MSQSVPVEEFQILFPDQVTNTRRQFTLLAMSDW